MPQCCINKLHNLYHHGKEFKTWKVSIDQAHKILAADVILHDWYAQCIVTVPNIKASFSLTPIKMTEILDDVSGSTEAMELKCRLLEMTLIKYEENMGAEEPEEQTHDTMAIDSVWDD